MPHCKTCGDYYRTNQFNTTDQCINCVDTLPPTFDEEDMLEIEHIINPRGKTLPRFLYE